MTTPVRGARQRTFRGRMASSHAPSQSADANCAATNLRRHARSFSETSAVPLIYVEVPTPTEGVSNVPFDNTEDEPGFYEDFSAPDEILAGPSWNESVRLDEEEIFPPSPGPPPSVPPPVAPIAAPATDSSGVIPTDIPSVIPLDVPAVIPAASPAAIPAAPANIAEIMEPIQNVASWVASAGNELRVSQGTASTNPFPAHGESPRDETQQSLHHDVIRTHSKGRKFNQSEISYLNYVIESLYQLIVDTALDNNGIQYRNTFAWRFQVPRLERELTFRRRV
jgi:hypothetical protein